MAVTLKHRKAALFLACLLWPACASSPGARGWRNLPVVPPLSGAVGAHVRAIVANGRQAGLHRDVFAKVGDSITESGSFMQDLACSEPRFGPWARLRGTWELFRRETFPTSYTSVWCGTADSYSRASLAAVRGWAAADALQPRTDAPPRCAGRSAVACEVALLKPSVALVLLGTNDLDRTSPRGFRRNLAEVVATISEAGVVPVVSTIPPRTDRGELEGRVAIFNRQIAMLAKHRALPLWNYWRQMRGAPDQGLATDGIHPSLACPPCNSNDFTARGLTQGYDLRNLGALRVLDRLRRVALAG